VSEVVFGVVTENKKKMLQVLEESDDCVVHLIEHDFYLIK
jgi:hypothetical protein